MRFYELEEALTPSPSPALRERGARGDRRGEGRWRASGVVRGVARQLRREPTESEQLLWEALRNRGLAGRKFRRQHPVGRSVLDFYCPEARLAIEVDGGIHDFRREADRERQRILESMGIRALRLSAGLVERDLSAAIAAIEEALTVGPSPALRERGGPKGRGEA